MARDIYCRYCDWPTEVSADHFPATCDHCKREGRWTTMAPVSDVPRVAWTLNVNDRKMLKALRISPEIET